MWTTINMSFYNNGETLGHSFYSSERVKIPCVYVDLCLDG